MQTLSKEYLQFLIVPATALGSEASNESFYMIFLFLYSQLIRIFLQLSL